MAPPSHHHHRSSHGSARPRISLHPQLATRLHGTEIVNPEDPGYPIPFPYTPLTGTQPVMMAHSLMQGMSAMMPPPVQGLSWDHGRPLNHNTPPPGVDKDEQSKRSKDIEDLKAIIAGLHEEAKIAREREEKRQRKNEIAEVREEAEKAAKDAADKVREELEKKLKEAEAAKEEAVTKLEEIAREAKNKPAPDVGEAPIKFKAAGREYFLPFHSCKTWKGMESLMEEALAPDDVIRGQVNQGQYHLMGPDGKIILPLIWESMIQPGWAVSLQMWREPEEAKERAKPASRSRTDAGSTRSRSTHHGKRRQRKSSCAVM